MIFDKTRAQKPLKMNQNQGCHQRAPHLSGSPCFIKLKIAVTKTRESILPLKQSIVFLSLTWEFARKPANYLKDACTIFMPFFKIAIQALNLISFFSLLTV